MSTDQTVIAFLDALDEATAASSPEGRLAAGRRALAALASVPVRRGGNRRGPKIRHDRDWAMNRLLEFAIEDPDGLPAKQTDLVERLRIAFEMHQPTVPGETWLKRVVCEFYRRAEAQDRELGEKYRKSPEIWSLFPTEKEFIFRSRIELRFEEQWWREKALRQRFLTASDYVIAMTKIKPSGEAKTPPELATYSD